ncbi:MAG: MBL fold metallo-hydrolase, partial [Clostridia bacterium]|nr:MBL fold metallo-hydrolase [Clostridia bacterium]
DTIIKHYQTKCYISEIELEKLYNPKMNYSIVFNTFYSSKLEEEHFVKLQDQNEFLLGNFKVKTMLTPGHTSGCMCYLINNTYLFTGDTLFKSSHGRTDLLTSSSDQMSKSLKFLKNNFSGQTFYPGHGEEGIVNN